MAVIVEAVEPGTAVGIWPRVVGMIDAGLAVCDEAMPEDILDRIGSGKMLLWVAIEQTNGIIIAAMTTELVKQRSGLVCWMCQCGGERMGDWSRFHTKIEEYARAEGCVRVVLEGREAWKRVLEGYHMRSVRLEKVL
jgi:2-oxoglutarate dehydrogenase complex dehydrogenase (E1) component-like enzyme